MKIGIYSETLPYDQLSGRVPLLTELGYKLDVAVSPSSISDFEELVEKHPEQEFGLWPVFANSKPPYRKRDVIRGTYWITKNNLDKLGPFVKIASEYDNINSVILDIEVLPIWKNQFKEGDLESVVTQIQDKGLEVRVTTPLVTPPEIIPKNADMISLQVYGRFLCYRELMHEMLNSKSASGTIKRFASILDETYKAKKKGLDMGCFTGGPLHPSPLKGVMKNQPHKLVRELLECKKNDIAYASIFELKPIPNSWLTEIAKHIE